MILRSTDDATMQLPKLHSSLNSTKFFLLAFSCLQKWNISRQDVKETFCYFMWQIKTTWLKCNIMQYVCNVIMHSLPKKLCNMIPQKTQSCVLVEVDDATVFCCSLQDEYNMIHINISSGLATGLAWLSHSSFSSRSAK